MSDPLITVDQILTRLGLGSTMKDEMAPALTAAAQGAQARLEAQLITRVGLGSGSELFRLEPTAYSGIQPDGAFRLLLTNGFLIEDSVVVQVVQRWSGIVVETLTEGADWHASMDLGLIYVDERHAERYIQVTYESGFADSDDVKERAPWVAEALLCFVPLVLNATRSAQEDGSGSSGWRLSGELAQGMIGQYNRLVNFCMRPISSTWKVQS